MTDGTCFTQLKNYIFAKKITFPQYLLIVQLGVELRGTHFIAYLKLQKSLIVLVCPSLLVENLFYLQLCVSWSLLAINQYRTSNLLLQGMQEEVIDFQFVCFCEMFCRSCSLMPYQLLSEHCRRCSRNYWKMLTDKGNPSWII